MICRVSPNESARFDTVAIDDALVVSFPEEHLLESRYVEGTFESLSAVLDRSDATTIVLDFGNVRFLCTTALGFLIPLHTRLAAQNRKLRLCNLQPLVHEVFAITHLDRLLDICEERHTR